MNRRTVEGVLSDGEKLTLKKMVPVHNASRYEVRESNHNASRSRLGILVMSSSLGQDHRSNDTYTSYNRRDLGRLRSGDLAQQLRG
jgi:hypothetical protein